MYYLTHSFFFIYYLLILMHSFCWSGMWEWFSQVVLVQCHFQLQPHLKIWLELEDHFPRWFTHKLVSWYRLLAGSLTHYGRLSVLMPWRPASPRVSMTWPQNRSTITSAMFSWLHRPALVWCEQGLHKRIGGENYRGHLGGGLPQSLKQTRLFPKS